jgi:hypothetical protein
MPSQYDSVIPDYVASSNAKYGVSVPVEVFRSLIGTESSFQQYDKFGNVLESAKGYKGLGQLGAAAVKDVRPGATTDEITSVINDPYQNMQASSDYLALLVQRYGNLRDGLAHYKGAGGSESYALADQVLQQAGYQNSAGGWLDNILNSVGLSDSQKVGGPNTPTVAQAGAGSATGGKGESTKAWGTVQNYAASAAAIVLGVGLLLILANKDILQTGAKRVFA